MVGRLQSIGVSSVADSEQVMLLAQRLAEIEACDADIKAHGRVFENVDPKTKSVSIKANPAVAQRSEAMRHSQSLLADFGLSPASRGKVSATEKKKQPVNSWQEIANS
jgi:P27 family predicted phage terminase small subunit